MNEIQSVALTWIVLAVGVVSLGYVLIKSLDGKTAPQTATLLIFPVALILAALFSSRISGLKLGADGLELTIAKNEVVEAIKSNPKLAEQVTNKQGDEAIRDVTQRVQSAENWDELQKVSPYKLKVLSSRANNSKVIMLEPRSEPAQNKAAPRKTNYQP